MPYSKYPPCYKDLAFWLPAQASTFHDNNFYEIVRGVAGDLVENVAMVRFRAPPTGTHCWVSGSRASNGTPACRVSQIDQFKHPKSGRESRCYRIMYRSMDRSLTNQQVNVLQEQVRADVVKQLGVEIR